MAEQKKERKTNSGRFDSSVSSEAITWLMRLSWMGLWKEMSWNSSFSCQMSQECLALWTLCVYPPPPPMGKKKVRGIKIFRSVWCCLSGEEHWNISEEQCTMWFWRRLRSISSFFSHTIFLFSLVIHFLWAFSVALFFSFLLVVHDGKFVRSSQLCKQTACNSFSV